MFLPNRITTGLVALVGLVAWSPVASATAVADFPPSLAGSYLAARSADQAKDISAAAAFYTDALSEDPENPTLLERVVVLDVAAGQFDEALEPARRLVALDSGNPMGRMVLAVQSIAAKDYAGVPADLAKVGKAPLASLTNGLIDGWVDFGLGKPDEGVAVIKALNGPSWYGIFKDYHRALILDAAGHTSDAVAAITKAYNTDGSALRVVEGYARIMARAGQRDAAIKALTDFAGASPLHPAVKELLDDLRAGKPIAPVASTAAEGVAEALYGLGSAIGNDGGPELPLSYLRLALQLDPHLYLADMAVGDVLQASSRCDAAIIAYERVPRQLAVRRNADLQIAACLQDLKKPEQAVDYVRRVLDANPKDVEAAVMLGDIYRSMDKFAEAADAYSRGIAALTSETADDWRIYYYRGVSEERSKQWPAAEADFKHALKLSPNQPSVLNYLGYSWVDMGTNLDQALAMIKQAVDLRPNDGYIVDSLGWAYYKLHRYQDAVDTLLHAVQLRPEDSTINDHYGDALWRVGRKLEATFQWAHARDMNPEPGELPKILEKLKHGLPPVPGGDTGMIKADATPAAPAAATSQPATLSPPAPAPQPAATTTPAATTPPAPQPAAATPPATAPQPAATSAPPAAKSSAPATAPQPASTTPPPPAPAAQDAATRGALPDSITVGKGDSLSTISAKVYGDSSQYWRLYRANRATIQDPDRIFPGMMLRLPNAGAN